MIHFATRRRYVIGPYFWLYPLESALAETLESLLQQFPEAPAASFFHGLDASC